MTSLDYEQQQPVKGGRKSSFLLVLINSVSMIIALAMVGVSAWGLAAWKDAPEGSWENVPSWAFYGALAFGIFVMLISGLGCVGAKKRNKCALIVYIVVVLIALIVQVAVATYALGYYNYLGDAKDTKSWDKVDSNVQKYIIDGFVQFAEAQPAKWKDLQDYNECCGYNLGQAYASDCNGAVMRDPLVVSTGTKCAAANNIFSGNVFCASITAAKATGTAALKSAYEGFESGAEALDVEFCQVKLLEETEKYSMGLGVAAVVMVLSTFVALVAASRLACCVSTREGGYAEEFGYGGSKDGQQTTGGALSGTGPGVNYA